MVPLMAIAGFVKYEGPEAMIQLKYYGVRYCRFPCGLILAGLERIKPKRVMYNDK